MTMLMLMILAQGAFGSSPCIAKELDKTFGAPGDGVGHSIQMTSDGGYIIAGSIRSNTANGNDVLLIKTEKDGNEAWSQTFGGSRDDESYSVLQADDGGYLVVGSTKSFGAGGYDVWAIRTDRDGNKIWDQVYGGRLDDEGSSVQRTSDGGYIILGKTRSLSVGGDYDAWLIKIDKYGNEIWDRSFGGPLDDEGYSVLQTNDGGYAFVATTKSFGAGDWDAWLVRTDGQGNKIWDRTFGGPKSESNPWSNGWSVRQTDDGGYILVGSTSSFGAGGYDVWAIKADENGNYVWDKTFGGPLDDEGDSVQQTSDGGYIIVGSTSSYGAGGYDAWLIKTGEDGSKVWDMTFGGKRDDKGYSLPWAKDDGYAVVGRSNSYDGSANLEMSCCEINKETAGGNRVWLIKIRSGTPAIIAQPKSYSICEGQSAAFSVEAIGAEPLVYQWKKNGMEISGAIAKTYSIPSASLDDAGSYSVLVSSACGLIESNAAMLIVNSKPLIQTQPQSQQVCAGSAVAFSVKAAGSDPFNYQWQKNGEEIAGANANIYSIPAVSINDAGGYSVVVSNACGSIESQIATLNVNVMPSIRVQPAPQEVCVGSSVTFSLEAAGTEPISYQWMKNEIVINGANSNSYSISKVSTEDSGSYSVIARNVCGSVESNAAALTVDSLPSIRIQPQSQLVCEGSSVTLSVEAKGTEPLSYQWMENGESIAGAITNTYTIPSVSSDGCNCYSVMVSNNCGSVESDIATLTLKSGPSIQVQPLSQVVCTGSPVNFNVNVTGTEPLSYQWKKDGAEIAGATTNIYAIPGASAEDAGSFSVIVSNSCGSVESSAADLTVNSLPSIQVQPQSQVVCSGSAATFSVEATGTEPLSYQWRKNGEDIQGANLNIYSIPSSMANDNGSFSVIVGNACGFVESNAATLTVNSMPSIQAQPLPQEICSGSAVTFSVVAAGTEPIAYQWKKNGVDIAGASANTYSIPSAVAEDAGSYSVMVSNSCGSVESDAESLKVDLMPSIQNQPIPQVTCGGSVVAFSVEASGTEPLVYQWRKDGVEIPGAISNNYSIESISDNDAGGYSVMVSNACGSMESNAATLTVNSMPSIQIQPQSQVICKGSAVAFSVKASGTEPLAYQWKKDGVEIPGAISNNYSIESVSDNDVGGYSIVISNLCGFVESNAATLTVNSMPSIQVQPISQVICSGSAAVFRVEATGTEPLAYQWKKDGIEIPGANTNTYAVPSGSAEDAGSYSMVISNSCGFVESNAATLTVNSMPSIQIQPLSQEVCTGSAVAFSVKVTGTEPMVYQWNKDGVEIPGASTNTYGVPSVGAEDAGSYSVMVNNSCGSVESNVAVLSVNSMPSLQIQPLCQEVCLGSPVTFSVGAAGSELLSYQWKKDGEDIRGASSNTYSIPFVTVSDEGCYSVVVSNGCGAVESNVATLKTSSYPSIVVQPSSQAVCESSAVVFSVGATGTGPLFYQWEKNGENITGANADSYTIPCVSSSDEGSYSVLVSNSCGSVESDTATLTISSIPSILVQPVCQDVCKGSPVTFSVEAAGTGPLAYQWKKDNKEIPGANSNTYTIPYLGPSDEGCYRVVVYNSCGWVESDTATLAIRKVPCIVTQPISQTSCACSCTCKPVTFSVTATGPKPLYYQWKKDGMILRGATSDQLRIYDVTLDSAGGYSVVVTNDYGSTESNAATLKVDQPPKIARKEAVCQAVNVGDTLTMRVEATGTGPLTYQWMKNGLNISDATSATYTLRNATKNDTGNYRVLVSNGRCSVESNIGTLKVAEVFSKPYCCE